VPLAEFSRYNGLGREHNTGRSFDKGYQIALSQAQLLPDFYWNGDLTFLLHP
jgi:hypothetical protein